MRLVDVRLMLSRDKKTGHFWDQKTFDKALALPVALCQREVCYPRRIELILTPNEMKEVPFCPRCLSQIKWS